MSVDKILRSWMTCSEVDSMTLSNDEKELILFCMEQMEYDFNDDEQNIFESIITKFQED